MSSEFRTYAPPPTDLEMRLRQIDAAIAAAEEWERKKAAREAEEARQEAARKAATGGYGVEQLKAARAALQAQQIERETHLRADAERDVMRRRAESLSAEIQIGETKLADLKAQRDALMAKLG